MSVWEFQSDDQKREMEESITPENCGRKLQLVRDVSQMTQKDLARVLGCSESTIFRLESGKTLPTADLINRLRALVLIGYHRFKRLSAEEKETIAETLGSVGGVAAGIGASIGAVSAVGSVAGLSAAGITSGLAALGGGAMLGGIAVVAAIPVAVGLSGYGLVKAIKAVAEANNLSCVEVDGRYELVPGLGS